MRVHILLASTFIVSALCGSGVLPIAGIDWFDGPLWSDDLPRHLLALPVRVGDLEIKISNISACLHRVLELIQLLLVVLEVHHVGVLLLAGGTKIILIWHGNVSQGVPLRIEGLDVLHV